MFFFFFFRPLSRELRGERPRTLRPQASSKDRAMSSHTVQNLEVLYTQHDGVRTTMKKKVHTKFFQIPFLGCQWVVWLGKRTWSAIGPFYLINHSNFWRKSLIYYLSLLWKKHKLFFFLGILEMDFERIVGVPFFHSSSHSIMLCE